MNDFYRLKFLVIPLIFTCCHSSIAQKSDPTELSLSAQTRVFVDIYRPELSWHNCYAGDINQAIDILKKREFIGATDFLSVESVKSVASDIELNATNIANQKVSISIKSCPFDAKDWDNQFTCRLTVQTKANTAVDEYLLEVNKAWAILDPSSQNLIDCQNKSAKVIRNAWPQSFSMADIKTLKFMVSQGHDLNIKAFGTVKKGGSLYPLQNWSGQLWFQIYYSGIEDNETYDASVDQLSVEKELDSWLILNEGRWSPWSVQISQLKCGEDLEIENPLAKDEVSLSPFGEIVKSYCSKKLKMGQ